MRALVLGLVALIGLVATVQAAPPDAQVVAPVKQFLDSFNKGDTKGAAAAHAAEVTIIDEVAPHMWQGRGAFEAWARDLGAHDKKLGITDQKVTLGEATTVVVSGDHAYVVNPATYVYKEQGKAMRETAQMAFALAKEASGWKIAGWTWAGTPPKADASAGK